MLRRCRCRAQALLLAACSLVFIATARADQPPTSAPKSDKPATAGPPVAADARPLLEAQLKRIREAVSMSGKRTSEWKVKVEGDSSVMAPETPTKEFALSKPSNVWIKSGDFTVIGDGKTLTVHHVKLHQYVQKPISASTNIADEVSELTGGRVGIEGEALINPSLTLERSLRRFTKVTGVRAATEGGKAGTWVTGTLAANEKSGSDAELTAEIFFPAGEALGTKVRVDYTPLYAVQVAHHEGDDEVEESARVLSAIYEMSYSNVEWDKPIPAEKFMFTPGKDDKKVAEFSPAEASGSPQEGLLGLPAPAFEGKDIDGNALKLADFKGKVVVMDFWATWCAPCVQAMPTIQALKEQYEGKDVVFLGINQDAPGSEKAVRKVLEKHKITFRQFDDSEGAASQAYRIGAIPCIVLINKAGVVQAIHVGHAPGEDKKLAKELDSLLANNPLKTDSEFKAAAQGGDEMEDDGSWMTFLGAKKLDMRRMSPERITADGSVGRSLTGFMSTGTGMGGMAPIAVDLSGNGQLSLVVQAQGSGSLAIVSPDGSSVKKVKLEGLSGSTLSSAQLVTLHGEKRWLVGGKTSLGLFSMEGKRFWTFDPGAPEGASVSMNAAVGDIDGDSTPEVVVFIEAYTFEDANEQDCSRGAALAVLDASGAVQTQHPLEVDAMFMHLCPSPSAGKPGTLLVGGPAGVKRYRYDPKAKAVDAVKSESGK